MRLNLRKVICYYISNDNHVAEIIDFAIEGVCNV